MRHESLYLNDIVEAAARLQRFPQLPSCREECGVRFHGAAQMRESGFRFIGARGEGIAFAPELGIGPRQIRRSLSQRMAVSSGTTAGHDLPLFNNGRRMGDG